MISAKDYGLTKISIRATILISHTFCLVAVSSPLFLCSTLSVCVDQVAARIPGDPKEVLPFDRPSKNRLLFHCLNSSRF